MESTAPRARRAFAPTAFATPIDSDRIDASVHTSSSSSSSMHTRRCVVVGPPESGKTTMLMRFCIRFIKENPGAKALFIARRDAMERARIHATRVEMLGDVEAVEAIGMRYVESDEDVRTLACFRHLWAKEEQPRLVVVDDLGSVMGGSKVDRTVTREMSYAKTLAALHECARDDETGEERLLVVSERTDEATGKAPMLYVYNKWFGEVLQIHRVHGEGGGSEWDLVAQTDGASVRYSTSRG